MRTNLSSIYLAAILITLSINRFCETREGKWTEYQESFYLNRALQNTKQVSSSLTNTANLNTNSEVGKSSKNFINYTDKQNQSEDLHTNTCNQKPNVCQNGATCVSKPAGKYECLCVNGWQGQNCTENVDYCATAACMNGAICHGRVGYFHCECPPGKTGLLCQLDDGCYNNPNACYGNASCDTSPVDGKPICTCPPGFSGQDCSIDLDECAAGDPCEYGGKCVNLPGSFRCDCPKGFTGDRCEINEDECRQNPCMNDAMCLDLHGSYKCVCQPGFEGQRCEVNIDECAANPCQNGAACKDFVNSFRCLCPTGYWGQRCEYNSSNSKSPAPNGLGMSEDGSLELPALGAGNPWSKCPSAYACFALFKDGKCDQDCNIAECLYDGNDCAPTSAFYDIIGAPPSTSNTATTTTNSSNTASQNNNNAQSSTSPSSSSSQASSNISPKKSCESDLYCLKNYANGNCDQECNSAECSWDGLDCDDLAPMHTQAQGFLVIRVEPAIEPEIESNPESRIELARLIRRISLYTKSVLKIQSYRTVDDGRGSEIELIADNRYCQASCYNSTELIAKFLSALRSRTKEFDKNTGALTMTDIKSSTQSIESLNSSTQQSIASTVWMIVCGSLATVCTVLMVISIGNKQKVKEKAIVWFPEGFKPVLSSRNRDPTHRPNQRGGQGRGVSTLQALGGNFFRGMKRHDRTAVSINPTGGLHSTDIDRCQTATPNGDGIYHIPYDYDQYGSTYNGTDSIAQMDQHHQAGSEPMTPTALAVNPLNLEGPHGLTPLMVASMGGQQFSKEPLGLVAYGTTGEVEGATEASNVTDLLERGAQLNLTSKVTGETALHLAARCGRADNASRLLAHCDSKDVNAKDTTGRTPLHAAIAADSLGVFELLIRNRGTDLNAQTHDGTTPLILAAKVGNYSMLEELILNECEVTKTDANGKTALHWAAAVNNVDIIRRLLAVREINKDAQDLAEETPLFLAAREGARGAVEILLSHNANREIKDQMDMSPIDIARAKKHDDIVRLLDEHEPPTPRSLASMHAHSTSSRQISPFSPDSNSSSSTINFNLPPTQQQQPPPPAYHSHTLSNGATRNAIATGGAQGGRQAQRAALARSNSTKPLIAEANIIRNNLQNHCTSLMVIKSNIDHPQTQTHTGLYPEVYNVPCLKNIMMTPSPEGEGSPYSPPVAYGDQQYQNIRQAGVFI